jgi:iron complex outermembrane receptor protein
MLRPRIRRSGRPLTLWLVLAAPAAWSDTMPDPTTLSLEQLLDVTIVGASKYAQKQDEVAAAVTVITRQEIQAFGWHTLAEALSSLPGVYTTYDRQYSYIGMRGFGLPGDLNTRVLITIDGNRVNDPTFDQGPTGPEFPLDMDMVERIEFIPGPGGAVYGQNAMLGVVNVITRSGATLAGAEVAASYQDPQAARAGRASWGTVLDSGVDLLVSASDLYSRGENRFFDFGAADVSGTAVGMDGERNQQILARIAAGPWKLEEVFGNHTKDDPTAAFLSDPLVPGGYQGDRHGLTQLEFEHSYATGDTLQVSGRLFDGSESYRSRLTFGGAPFLSPASSEWYGAELRVLSTALAGQKLMIGLETQENSRENQAAVYPIDPAADYFIGRSGYRIGVYGQDEWRVGESLAATLGLRIDRDDATGAKTSPRLGLIWQAASATTLKALYGVAHRTPNSYERDYDDGVTQVSNLALHGETIDTLELVADQRVSRNLALRASVYQWTLDDPITLGIEPVGGLPQYQSGETVKARGVELSADNTWDVGARLRGSFSAQDAAYADGRDLPNSPKLLGKLNLSAPVAVAGMRAGYELQYDSRRLTLDGTYLGGYVLSNLILSTDRLAPGLALSLGLYNLFDKHYAQPGADTNWQNAFEQDGRSIMLKVVYRFCSP